MAENEVVAHVVLGNGTRRSDWIKYASPGARRRELIIFELVKLRMEQEQEKSRKSQSGQGEQDE